MGIKFDKFLYNIIQLILLLLLLSMFVLTITGVFNRYVLNKSIMGTEELGRYLMFYMVMLGSALAFRLKKHPSIYIFTQKFPNNYLRVLNIIQDTIIIVILLIIFKEGYSMAVNSMISKTPAMRISFFWVYLSLPIGSSLMAVQIIFKYLFHNSENNNK
jgi:TRAP-type C4-dicarboxylate transport system permease small subunit